MYRLPAPCLAQRPLSPTSADPESGDRFVIIPNTSAAARSIALKLATGSIHGDSIGAWVCLHPVELELLPPGSQGVPQQ